jgi:thiol:disulfide interchange protein DsbA
MRLLRLAVACLAFAFLNGPAAAAPENAYQPLNPPQPTVSGARVEVLEIFWYGCPHCYALEPYLEKWKETKPEDVEFVRVPAVLNRTWIPHARAYYTAQKLGVLDKIHSQLFNALHRERKSVYTDAEIRKFFVEQGVSGDDFDRVYNSHEVDTRMKQALVIARGAKITGVPAIIISGKYMTSGPLAGSYEGIIEVIDTLVAREREAAAPAN